MDKNITVIVLLLSLSLNCTNDFWWVFTVKQHTNATNIYSFLKAAGI